LGTPDTSKIDQPWPDDGLEQVECCPYCNASERTLAHGDVQDWSFYCAPGKWTYWNCTRCNSLYLDPRPTPATVGQAYGAYYTHHRAHRESLAQWVKERVRNECCSHWLKTDLRPRLHIPKGLSWLLIPLKSRLVEPFEIAELVKLPKGKLMDVGCGNGYTLSLAKKLGWQAMGLEIDPAAARAARTQGLDVVDGSYARLAAFRQEFDCIICSHVLEHVHDPQDMLIRLAEALKPGGTLLLSLPNATSLLRYLFGDDWRGLEAPRHLSIPSMSQLEAILREMGFSVRQRQLNRWWTAAESSRIQRRGTRLNTHDKAVAKRLTADTVVSSDQEHDFVQFVCVRDTRRVL
jgi:2-polyprenyl-3-methyl-5-hydroxy-6-metoxy-1,4-benzoquinol methylase